MIQANDLVKTFGSTRAVDRVSLAIPPGEIYGLVGPDGAGKTTTIRMLCGALTPDSGSVEIAGISTAREVERARENIGYLSQRFSLYEELTTQENLRFFAEVRGMPRELWETRSQEILQFVGLADFRKRRAGQLSGGMKQKLGLAIALINNPKILLLDEPTTGVDPLTRQDFWQLIIRLVQKENVSVLVSTPYMDEASRCHRVGFLRGGRLVAEGAPRDLRAMLQGRVLEVTGSPLELVLRKALRLPGVESAQRFGDRLHLTVQPEQARNVRRDLSRLVKDSGGRLEKVEAVAPLLEDVFIAVSGGFV
jgi:ABC-2 type transport system ATP-binding protein